MCQLYWFLLDLYVTYINMRELWKGEYTYVHVEEHPWIYSHLPLQFSNCRNFILHFLQLHIYTHVSIHIYISTYAYKYMYVRYTTRAIQICVVLVYTHSWNTHIPGLNMIHTTIHNRRIVNSPFLYNCNYATSCYCNCVTDIYEFRFYVKLITHTIQGYICLHLQMQKYRIYV